MYKFLISDLPVYLNGVDVGVFQTLILIYVMLSLLEAVRGAVSTVFYWKPGKISKEIFVKLFYLNEPFPFRFSTPSFCLGP